MSPGVASTAWYAKVEEVAKHGSLRSIEKKLGITRSTPRETLIAALLLADQEIEALRTKLSYSVRSDLLFWEKTVVPLAREHASESRLTKASRSRGKRTPEPGYDWLGENHTADSFRRATGNSDAAVRAYLKGERPLKNVRRGQRQQFGRATALRVLARWLSPQAKARSGKAAKGVWDSACLRHYENDSLLKALRRVLVGFHPCELPRPPVKPFTKDPMLQALFGIT